MAQRGSNKELSRKQESRIAFLYDGKVSPSSGAADNDSGDVRCPHILIECKMTKSKPPKFVKEFEKIRTEAYEEGREPVLALRYYDPESNLADKEGWIDLVVRTAFEDSLREEKYAEARQE